jgi:hypothetical protein
MKQAREGAPTFKGRALRQLHPIVRRHATALEVRSNEDAPSGTQGSRPILTFDAPTKLHDITAKLTVRSDSDHEPIQPNGLIRIDGFAKADPELQPDHRTAS